MENRCRRQRKVWQRTGSKQFRRISSPDTHRVYTQEHSMYTKIRHCFTPAKECDQFYQPELYGVLLLAGVLVQTGQDKGTMERQP